LRGDGTQRASIDLAIVQLGQRIARQKQALR